MDIITTAQFTTSAGFTPFRNGVKLFERSSWSNQHGSGSTIELNLRNRVPFRRPR